LAKGVDEYNHFDLEQRPKVELDLTSQESRKNALKRQHDLLFKGANKKDEQTCWESLPSEIGVLFN
jgi:hypothetical protein